MLARGGMSWRLMRADGDGLVPTELPAPCTGAAVSALLAARPEMLLYGEGHGRCITARFLNGGLTIEHETLGPLSGGSGLRVEHSDARVDRNLLARLLEAGGLPGAVKDRQARLLGAARFITRLLDLFGPGRDLSILECGSGPAPLSIALAASLRAMGRCPHLVVIDESPGAIRAAQEFAAGLDLTGTFLMSSVADYHQLSPSPDLLLAVHACASATRDSLALGLSSAARAIALVPCCAPEGTARARGLLTTAPPPAIERLMDGAAFAVQCAEELTGAGYDVDAYEVYLRPWRHLDLAISAYLPSTKGML